MKRYSTSLISGKIQIKTSLRYYLTPVRMTVIKKQKTSVRVWLYCNHCTLLVRMQNGVMTMENSIVVLKKKLKIELPYVPAIPFLGIYPKGLKLGSWRNISTSMFPAALFTISEMWKQLKSIDEWMKKENGYMYTLEYYSILKKKEIMQ